MAAYSNHWLIKVFNDLLNERGMTKGDLAILCDLHPTHTGEILRGQYLPRIKTAERILEFFGYELDAVLSSKTPNTWGQEDV